MKKLEELIFEAKENPIKIRKNKVVDDFTTELRETKEYINVMNSNAELHNFADRWSFEVMINRLIGYEELPPQHRVAIHMQIAMLLNIDFVDLENDDIRHIALKKLRNEVE